jgi:hypothetical protein
VVNSEFNTLNSELKEGDLMLWIMAGPRWGKIGSSEFKAQNKSEIYNLKSKMN